MATKTLTDRPVKTAGDTREIGTLFISQMHGRRVGQISITNSKRRGAPVVVRATYVGEDKYLVQYCFWNAWTDYASVDGEAEAIKMVVDLATGEIRL